MKTNVASLDPNFGVPGAAPDTIWRDIRDLGVEGRGWTDTESYYDRLPARAANTVPEAVWQLSKCSAGMCVRFVTDAPRISARWTLRQPALSMDHMPVTGVSGLDLYGLHEGRWRFAGVARNAAFPLSEVVVINDMTPTRRTFVLNLPLYNGVESVEVGVPIGSTLEPGPTCALPDPRPICFYGTSIVQGGCASRPGMAYTQILGRRLGRPTINLGFSGNARCEPAVAELLAELDPCTYVLDPLPNMQEPQVTERLGPFVRVLRDARPSTPIVLVGQAHYETASFRDPVRLRCERSNEALRRSLDELRGSGVDNLHFAAGDRLLGEDTEATVDGIHPTDLGFMRMADALEPVLRQAKGDQPR